MNKKQIKIITEIESLLPKRMGAFVEKETQYHTGRYQKRKQNAFVHCYDKNFSSFIFLFPVFWTYGREKQTRILFHEIAHLRLHHSKKKNNEVEADKLAKRWMGEISKK
ncbi:hypothetical protein HOA55_04970 [archaeon]|jgi:predicted SprT family Zn-dependent metalloprotease|nr:hypothetical protein [archaeon]MBT6820680.1 hypothetical protein [archaeon]MBT7024910.1 hypothetical protein [archaeon]MBT7238529.1 hypothetical protein [archaeon]MBT7567916.1 hypothetical protein [archaeon]